jgi:hypothetical protein
MGVVVEGEASIYKNMANKRIPRNKKQMGCAW